MTTLTMEQRRRDFEAMLKRANRVRAAGQERLEMFPEADGLMLARLTEEVSDLCRGWHEAAHRASLGSLAPYTVGQVKKHALQVAAHGLAALRDRTTEGYLAPIREMGHQLNDRDLGMDPGERIGWLLSTLGDLGTCYHRNLDPNGSITVFRLRSLTVEALCAALAADRGLWQEES
jgi:hypothetical protein